jgi:hypothetical protein
MLENLFFTQSGILLVLPALCRKYGIFCPECRVPRQRAERFVLIPEKKNNESFKLFYC